MKTCSTGGKCGLSRAFKIGVVVCGLASGAAFGGGTANASPLDLSITTLAQASSNGSSGTRSTRIPRGAIKLGILVVGGIGLVVYRLVTGSYNDD